MIFHFLNFKRSHLSWYLIVECSNQSYNIMISIPSSFILSNNLKKSNIVLLDLISIAMYRNYIQTPWMYFFLGSDLFYFLWFPTIGRDVRLFWSMKFEKYNDTGLLKKSCLIMYLRILFGHIWSQWRIYLSSIEMKTDKKLG